MPPSSIDWNARYLTADTPWDSGEPSQELARILSEGWVQPCRALEMGCGTGTNAVFLATQGFEVTALDLAGPAVEQARARAARAGVRVRFLQADVLAPPELGPAFPFVFDRGVYHHVREVDLDRFLEFLARVCEPGGFYLTLAGNANEPAPAEGGPPRVHAHEISLELAPLFDLVQLREFRFDGVCIQGREVRPLAWSALLRRKPPA